MLTVESFKKTVLSLSLYIYVCVCVVCIYILYMCTYVYMYNIVSFSASVCLSLSPPLSGSLDVGWVDDGELYSHDPIYRSQIAGCPWFWTWSSAKD